MYPHGGEQRKTSGFLRFFWYLCAAILLLSLPTFSYLVPRSSFLPGGSSSKAPAERRSLSTPGFLPPKTLDRRSGSRAGAIGARPGNETGPIGSDLAAGSAQGRVFPGGGVVPGSSAQNRSLPSVGKDGEKPRRSSGREVRGGPPRQTLGELQQSYQRAYAALFQGLRLAAGGAKGNPFEEALSQGEISTAEGGKKVEDGLPSDATAEADSGGDSNPPAEPSEPSDPSDPSDSNSGEDSPAPPPVAELGPFDFLITGNFSRDGEGPLVWRARRDGNNFILENSEEVSFFPGFAHFFFTFYESDKVVTKDLNGDGLIDFVVARVYENAGTKLESYVRTPEGGFVLDARAWLYLRAVNSFALFDFNQDGVDELAVVSEKEPNLYVYQKAGQVWSYLKEMVLPLEPGIVVSSQAGLGLLTTYLYVISHDLGRVVSINSRTPTAFRVDSGTILNYFGQIEVDLNGRGLGDPEILALGVNDQIVLMQRDSFGRVKPFIAFLDLDLRMPSTFIGDYAGKGTRQILWIP